MPNPCARCYVVGWSTKSTGRQVPERIGRDAADPNAEPGPDSRAAGGEEADDPIGKSDLERVWDAFSRYLASVLV
jgi:hypothetical protein